MPLRGAAFDSIGEMDDHLIHEINRVVMPGDMLIHAGDFAWQAGQVGHYRHRLSVRELLVACGNHDAASLVKYVSVMEHILFKKLGGHHFHIEHRPCLSWDKKQRGGTHVYGHSHGLFEDTLNMLWPGRRAMDIGVDHAFRMLGEWRPFSLDEVLHCIANPPLFEQCDMHADVGEGVREDHHVAE